MSRESLHLQVADLFEQAVALPHDRRIAFVDRVCKGNAPLRTELLSLLEANDSANGYFERLSRDVLLPAVSALPISGSSREPEDIIPRLAQALGATYHIDRELRGGRMSRVFLAEELSLGRQVVVKVLPEEMAIGMNAERFRQEIQLSAQLQHPHIVPVLAADAAGDLLYYTMPFVEGESLRARIAKEGALPLAESISVWRRVLEALAYAHSRGVVHRDIKPDNILLSGRSAVIGDFGIAVALAAAAGGDGTITQPAAVGTPAYMAPEQVAGGAIDHRIDIYAAGLVMYEMLEGRRPFTSPDSQELMSSRMHQQPTPLARPDVPKALVALVLQCIATQADKRPQSADEVLDRLEHSTTEDSPRQVILVRRGWEVGATLLLLAIIVLLRMAWLARADTADPRVSDPRPSLVMLPLESDGGDSTNVYFANVLSASLLEKFATAGDLRVIQAPSAFFFKGHHTKPQEIADSLGVDHVLTGTIHRDGSVIRVQVQLENISGIKPTWTHAFSGSEGDLFVLEDSVLRSISHELLPQLKTAKARRRFLPDPVAHELYRRGRYEENQRERQATLLTAIRYFSQAVQKDSTFADAYAALAVDYGFVATGNVSDFPYRIAIDSARYFAEKAIALDDSLPEAYEARAFVKMLYDFDWNGADADTKRAVDVNPYYNRLIHVRAIMHQWRGAYAKGVQEMRLNLSSDPMSPATRGELARALFFDRQYGAALAELDTARSISGGGDLPRLNLTEGEIHLNQRRFADAIAAFTRVLKATPESPTPRAFLAIAHARSGEAQQAQQLLDDLLLRRKTGRSNAFYVALAYAGLRDHDNAFRWLDSAYNDRSLRPLIMDPTFEALRADKRFDTLLRKIGLTH